ncbi:MAG: histidinol-phosphate transaminase [Desulfomonile tiedjei]|nr:histidinol-phosphate transaminase [Desulfomonile tiedjei]
MQQTKPTWVERAIPSHILSIPPYVPGKPVAELQRELGLSQAVKMASNENPLGPSPLAVRAMEEHLGDAHIYPESSGPDLRSALASRFGVVPDCIILGNGSDEIMQMAGHVFIQPDDEAIMGEHAFSMYSICVRAFGGTPILVPLKDHRADLPAIAKAVTPRTKLIFLAVPNSPTGTIVSRGEFESFVRDLSSKQLVLVLDEAYREYVQDPDCPNGAEYISSELPILVLRTFSKIHGLAGLRVGYGIAQPWLIELLNRVRPPFNVNSLAQVGALAALDDIEHVQRSLKLARDGMDYLSSELTSLGLEIIPSQSNFISFRWGNGARECYEALLHKGVIVRHLASFGMADWIRVTIGREDENRRFMSALKETLSALS